MNDDDLSTASIRISKTLRTRAKAAGINVSVTARNAVLKMVEYHEKVIAHEN